MIDSVSDLDRALEVYSFLARGGDDERMAYVVVRGDPASKRRPRFGKGRTYRDPAQAEAEATLGSILHASPSLREPFRGNVAIGCIFYRRTRQPVDVDNLLKHVLDSATGIAWRDDRQVTAALGVLEWDAENPRTVIVIGRHDSSLVRDEEISGYCETCGEPFTHPGWRENAQRFCSSACVARSRGQDLSEPVPCRQCDVPFKRANAYLALCSEECRREWLRGKNRGEAQPNYCDDCGERVPNHRAKRCRACWKVARAKGMA